MNGDCVGCVCNQPCCMCDSNKVCSYYIEGQLRPCQMCSRVNNIDMYSTDAERYIEETDDTYEE